MKNQRFLVIGLGVSGRAAAEYLSAHGVTVFVYDDDPRKGEDLKNCVPFEGASLKSIDSVVVSPGIPRTHPLYREALEKGIEVIGEVELACRLIKVPVVAVTGTNGKTTVTMLLEHIFNEAGIKVGLLGNGGVPLTKIDSDVELIVLELSSFQLETMKTPVLDCAAILNITPDHLDRYSSMEEYAATKMHIHRCLKPQGALYMEQQTYKRYGYLLNGFPCETYGDPPSFFPPSVLERPPYEIENILAAFYLSRCMNISSEAFFAAVETFKKPPHRIEFVRKIQGIAYYNDSKGTNVDAVNRCIQALKGKSVLIAGGVDKGSSFVSWKESFRDRVKAVITLGQAADKIEQQLQGVFPLENCRTLPEAIEKAQKHAESGENIVLSPGCASFDMFKNYVDRGDTFKRIVKEL